MSERNIFKKKGKLVFVKPFYIDYIEKKRHKLDYKSPWYGRHYIDSQEKFDELFDRYIEKNSRESYYGNLSEKDLRSINKQIYDNMLDLSTYTDKEVVKKMVPEYVKQFFLNDYSINNKYKDELINITYNQAYDKAKEIYNNKVEEYNKRLSTMFSPDVKRFKNKKQINENVTSFDVSDKPTYEKLFIIKLALNLINNNIEEAKRNNLLREKFPAYPDHFYLEFNNSHLIKFDADKIMNDENKRELWRKIIEGEKFSINDTDYIYNNVEESKFANVEELENEQKSGKTTIENKIEYTIDDLTNIHYIRPKPVTLRQTYLKHKKGGFLQYKIKEVDEILNTLLETCYLTENLSNEEVKECILNELKRCQITNNLKDKIFKTNCLAYGIFMSTGDEKLFKKIKINCINKRIISSDFISQLGKTFNIKFNIYDIKASHTYTYPKAFKTVGYTTVNLFLLHEHFFINEEFKLFRLKKTNQYIKTSYLVKAALTDKKFSFTEILSMPFCNEKSTFISLSNEQDFYKEEIEEYKPDEKLYNYIIDYERQRKEADIIEKENEDNLNEIYDKTVLVFADCEASVGPDYEYFEILNSMRLFDQSLKDISIIHDENITFEKLLDLDKQGKIDEINKYIDYDTFKKYANIKTSVYYHEAYCISYTTSNNINDIKTHYGRNCLYNFMDDMVKLMNENDNKLLVYFHNAGYDLNLFNKFNFKNKIQKGNKILSATILYKSKLIQFHDSLALMTMSIKSCARSFCSDEHIKKEMFPYKFYNDGNLNFFSEDGIMVDIENINPEIEGVNFVLNEFITNCINLDILNIKIKDINEYYEIINKPHEEILFDSKKYCTFYCEQDVRILAKSFMKFRNMFAIQFKLDITKYISLPAVASALMKANVLALPDTKEEDKNYKLSGELQAFIRESIYGGRCMTSQNKAWITNQNVISLDYVSLYPSAMTLLPIIHGKPEIMTKEEIENNNYLNLICDFNKQPNEEKYISGYVVDIMITKINSTKHFPRTTFKTDLGSQYIDFNAKLPQRVTLVDIMLEDIINAHDIEFYTIQGVKYCGKKDFNVLSDFINFLYDKRKNLKSKKNPAEIVFKLILNSSYGKLIQKLIETEIKFVRDRRVKTNQKLDKELKPILKEMGYNTVKEYLKDYPEDEVFFDEITYLLCGSIKQKQQFCSKFNIDVTEEQIETYKEVHSDKIEKVYQISEHLYELEEKKNLLNQFSDPYLGARILAMSKRIMNNTFVCVEGVEAIMSSLINKKETIKKYETYLLNNNIDNVNYFLQNPLFQDIKIEYEEELKQMGYSKENNPDLFEGDLNNIVFYQDTDSIYMKEKYLKQLEAIYKNLYGKDLYGENILNRMHIDFEESEMNCEIDKVEIEESQIENIKSRKIRKIIRFNWSKIMIIFNIF